MDNKTVETISYLARLKLDKDKKEKITKDLENIIDFVAELQDLNTEDIVPLSNPLEKVAPKREDSVTSKSRKEVSEIIDKIVLSLEKNNYLNDALYSDSKARNLHRRGYSLNKITYSLKSKGLEEKFIKNSIEKIKNEKSDPDFVSAIKICKKKRIGPARIDDNRPLFYKKDISLLARNGFDFETSKKVMELEKEDYLRIIKLL